MLITQNKNNKKTKKETDTTVFHACLYKPGWASGKKNVWNEKSKIIVTCSGYIPKASIYGSIRKKKSTFIRFIARKSRERLHRSTQFCVRRTSENNSERLIAIGSLATCAIWTFFGRYGLLIFRLSRGRIAVDAEKKSKKTDASRKRLFRGYRLHGWEPGYRPSAQVLCRFYDTCALLQYSAIARRRFLIFTTRRRNTGTYNFTRFLFTAAGLCLKFKYTYRK